MVDAVVLEKDRLRATLGDRKPAPEAVADAILEFLR